MKATDTNFWRFFDTRIADLENEGRWGTASNYLKAECSFRSFVKDEKLSLDDISAELIGSYDRRLLSRGLIRNSVSQYNRVLRAVYNNAVKKNLVADKRPFVNAYTGSDKTLKRALPERDIAKIAAREQSGSLQLVKDMFIFSYAACGMTFVDMAYLKKRDINGDILIYYRRKTGSRIHITLDPVAMKIIRKYSGKTADSQYVFPILGNRTGKDAYKRCCSALTEYNRGLKRLSGNAGVSRKDITSYVSRHSWATAARNNGAELCVISEALGHSSERTTRIFAGLDTRRIDTINRKLMKNFGIFGYYQEPNGAKVCKNI